MMRILVFLWITSIAVVAKSFSQNSPRASSKRVTESMRRIPTDDKLSTMERLDDSQIVSLLPDQVTKSDIVAVTQSGNDDDIDSFLQQGNTQKDVVSAIALVAGTTVGAGILALPSTSYSSGFGPSSVALFGSWMYMATTGLLIAEVSCQLARKNNYKTTSGILKMISQTLGKGGAVVGGLVYIFIHYALLVAYMAEGGGMLSSLTSAPAWATTCGFAAALGSILTFGTKDMVDGFNNVFAIIVLAAFAALVAIGVPMVKGDSLMYSDWSQVSTIVPVCFVALVYHNVVPFICAQLKYKKKDITTVVVGGSFIPMCMFLAWNFLILGIANRDASDISASGSIDSLTILHGAVQSQFIKPLVSLFSEAAIITSFIGFFVGLTDFFADLFPSRGRKHPVTITLVLLPPLVIALLFPSIFAGALDVAGTYGIAVLFGIMPAAMAFASRRSAAADRTLAGDTSINADGGDALHALPYERFVPGGIVSLGVVSAVAACVIGQKLVQSML
jgi:tyrosine-specific transport protein